MVGMAEPAPATKYLVKADGVREQVSVERIESHLRELAWGLNPQWVMPTVIAAKVVEGLCDGITAAALDTYVAETCAYMSQRHPDLALLAARVAVERLHRETSASFAETCGVLWRQSDAGGKPTPLVSEELHTFVAAHSEQLDNAIDYRRDFEYDYFAFKTLERSYLLKVQGRVVERPQHMLMRVACGIHAGNLQAALESYDLMSRRFFTHASPTLFHAGTPRPQLSSCYILSPSTSSIDEVFQAIRQCALIGDSAGGVGLCASDFPAAAAGRGAGGGRVRGLVSMLKLFNETARFVEAGGSSRPTAVAAYIEPWHAEVFEFLELRKSSGPEERRARDLFYGLWVPDLFMRRVEADADWSLFCPLSACDPNSGARLTDLWGEDFDALYERLELLGLARRTVRARQLWYKLLEAQVETGMPYMLYKDAVNRKSNQQHCGTIRCANLCTEVVQFSSPDETAVCNLASVSLPAFVRSSDAGPEFDFDGLQRVVKVMVRNLDRLIDLNRYPVDEARVSNSRHRPLGVGVQGFADLLLMLRLPFESQAARLLNEEIFEAIYFAACKASCELAAVHGPHPSYAGSPASRGQLQFHLWGVEPRSGRCDWEGLKARIAVHGMRNSHLVAPMPTASTAQLLGNSESVEPVTQNLYVRRVLSGEFVQLNRRLVADLEALGLWTEDLRQRLVLSNGSVQQLREVPEELKELYKTAWEVKQRAVLDLAADRGPFVDQSQSLSIFMDNPTVAKLTSMHFHGWKRGLKTGMYYLRTRPAVDATKVTIDPAQIAAAVASSRKAADASKACQRSSDIAMEEHCTSCTA